jgi:hypothetical protein
MAGRTAKAIAGLVAVILVAAQPAHAAGDLEAEARTMLTAVFDALATGDPGKVEPLLAEEFQVVRSDGGAYDKDEYLARSIPKITKAPVFDDVVATRGGDIVVVRFVIEYESVIDSKTAETRSPQLIVFRVRPNGWQVVAGANFATLTEQQ